MTAIKVENLSKLYVIDHQKQHSHHRYNTLAGALTLCGKRIYHQLRHPFSSISNTIDHEEFWALKDINFEINPGDKVGIIGRNGAGKSTLLKILSRITAPTTGKITINGRVSSLLEVGTGFHPELTGRENIFLNGAILGMKRQEIRNKFDEIVAFAEVEKFLDTPVKHYSSGMYVRLAFSVAAHLEPEILIVDEVLAVGDTQFQKKCLGKMEDVGNEGRTVLFVSHNLAALKHFCSKGILLHQGQNIYSGMAHDAVNFYTKSTLSRWNNTKTTTINPHIKSISINNQFGESIETLEDGDKCFLRINIYTANQKDIFFAFTIFTADDIGIFSGITTDTFESIPYRHCSIEIEIPVYLLNSGSYRIEGAFGNSTTIYEKSDYFLSFTYIKYTNFDIKGEKSKGIFRLPNKWIMEENILD
jgi:lipopolysaccharide transport system ATP-binding protein